jgi:hypothetical protein
MKKDSKYKGLRYELVNVRDGVFYAVCTISDVKGNLI